MPLIQSLDKTINIIMSINAGNDTEAASTLGLTSNRSVSSTGSFLERVCEIASGANGSHNGGVLVTPETKTISNKELVADALELPYAVSESLSVLCANALSALSVLTEEDEYAEPDENGNVDTSPVIDNDGMDNIKETVTDGLNTAQEALIDVFTNTAKLNLKSRELFKKCLEENGSSKELYVALLGNAITGSGILYGISKISDFTVDNKENVAEAMNSANAFQRADNILFGLLNLQENLINLYTQMNNFNNNVMMKLFNESVEMPEMNSGSLQDASDFIAMAIEQVAKPVSENPNMLNGEELNSTFDKAISCIAALYDEYLQDFCNSEDMNSNQNEMEEEPEESEEVEEPVSEEPAENEEEV